MIIQGLILTDKGPVDIKDLKIGDRVLNQMHRAFAVNEIEKKTVRGAYTFKKNPKLVVAKNTVLRTVYGNKKAVNLEKTEFYMTQPNMRTVKDKLQKRTGEHIAYVITAEGCDSLFASNYCLELEGNNA